MKLNLRTSIGSLLLLFSFSAFGVAEGIAERAVYRQNIPEMLTAANVSAENEHIVANALCSDIDLGTFSYEQLLLWEPLSKSRTISDMINHAIAKKELEICNDLRGLTAEEYAAYLKAFPKREKVAKRFLSDVLLTHVNDLSILELLYFDDCLPEEYHPILSGEISRRQDEIQKVLSEKVTDYNNYETALAKHFKHILEYTLWSYFVEGHRELNMAYSQIAMTPDDAYEAATQYQRLVDACIPKQRIRRTLQEEVNKFCEAVNQSRSSYFAAMGNDKFKKLAYKVPEFRMDTAASIAPLFGIAEARERYVRNREDISTGTSVLGWVFGGVVGLLAQGIGDWMAIEGLVDSEYEARKQYMESVQVLLIKGFMAYSNEITKGIDQSLQKSHN